MTTLESLKEKVTEIVKCEEIGPCWVWIGSYNQNRPFFVEEGKQINPARRIWELYYQKSLVNNANHFKECEKEGFHQSCVSPHHIYDGTDSDNRKDVVANHLVPLRKIKNKEEQIIDLYMNQNKEQQEIAKILKVNPMTIQRFLNGNTNKNSINYVQQKYDARDAKIKELFAQGKCRAHIAVEVGVSETTVIKIVPALLNSAKGIPKSVLSSDEIKERNKKIKEDKEAGLAVRAIANKYNLGVQSVYHILNSV